MCGGAKVSKVRLHVAEPRSLRLLIVAEGPQQARFGVMGAFVDVFPQRLQACIEVGFGKGRIVWHAVPQFVS